MSHSLRQLQCPPLGAGQSLREQNRAKSHTLARSKTAFPRCTPQRAAAVNDSAAESGAPQAAAWDPEGIFNSSPAGGHFARREKERVGAVTRPPPPGPPIRPLPGPPNPAGIKASDASPYDRRVLEESLAADYMPVDLDTPGLRIHNLDPPVFTVDSFFSQEECQAMSAAAMATGRMIASKVGAGNVYADAAGAAASARRTSTSVLVDDKLIGEHPSIGPSAALLHSRGVELLGGEQGRPWGAPGKLPAPGQYCYEALQVTQYERGQYFMEHEDGFPLPLAQSNGFNRHATLLIYLNDVSSGGATRFEHLGLEVKPRVGRALLFFPCFADGRPDARSLHTATEAEDTKIVTQQWVARGFRAAVLVGKAPGLQQKEGPGAEELLAAARRKGGDKKKGKGKKAAAPAKGFGAAS